MTITVLLMTILTGQNHTVVAANACRIANIAVNDAMILPYYPTLGRIEFSERIRGKNLSIPLVQEIRQVSSAHRARH